MPKPVGLKKKLFQRVMRGPSLLNKGRVIEVLEAMKREPYSSFDSVTLDEVIKRVKRMKPSWKGVKDARREAPKSTSDLPE